MDRQKRIQLLKKIADSLEKKDDIKDIQDVLDKPDKPDKPLTEQKKDFEILYSTLSTTPAGSFKIENDKDFDKAVQSVVNYIKQLFSNETNVSSIVNGFMQAVNNKNESELKNGFTLIDSYKKLKENIEKQAFKLANNSISKIS